MSESEIARLEAKMDAIDRTLRDFCLTVTGRLAAGDVRIAENQKDIDGLAQVHRKDYEAIESRISKRDVIIVSGFTILLAAITIYKFI